jgi:hypothetical protein
MWPFHKRVEFPNNPEIENQLSDLDVETLRDLALETAQEVDKLLSEEGRARIPGETSEDYVHIIQQFYALKTDKHKKFLGISIKRQPISEAERIFEEMERYKKIYRNNIVSIVLLKATRELNKL